MDKRIAYKIVIDTETAPIDKNIAGANPENMLVYDIGWAICDKRGNIYKTRSFLVRDIFVLEIDRMNSAYYAKKIPMYWKELHEGKRKMATFSAIRRVFIEDMKEYGVKEVYAHNMRFDCGSLNTTTEWCTNGERHYFFPKELTICDTMRMANAIMTKMPSYRAFCERNELMTNHRPPRPQTKAETIYKYLSNDLDFVESHTGLADVMIECKIMAYCFRQHKATDRVLYPARV